MAGCGDLERELGDLRRRIGDLERCTGCRSGGSAGGGGGVPGVNEERIIKRAVEQVFKDERWKANFRILKKIILGAGN